MDSDPEKTTASIVILSPENYEKLSQEISERLSQINTTCEHISSETQKIIAIIQEKSAKTIESLQNKIISYKKLLELGEDCEEAQDLLKNNLKI